MFEKHTILNLVLWELKGGNANSQPLLCLFPAPTPTLPPDCFVHICSTEAESTGVVAREHQAWFPEPKVQQAFVFVWPCKFLHLIYA